MKTRKVTFTIQLHICVCVCVCTKKMNCLFNCLNCSVNFLLALLLRPKKLCSIMEVIRAMQDFPHRLVEGVAGDFAAARNKQDKRSEPGSRAPTPGGVRSLGRGGA